MKKILSYISFCFLAIIAFSQEEEEYLLTNPRIQLECAEAVDSMYNFRFDVAEKQFGWLKQQYPEHPLGYFLMGLSQYWKIVPNDDVLIYDDAFFAYIDTAIDKAKEMYKKDDQNLEATFFLAASYGFKARRHSDHNNYGKAGVAAKACLNYLEEQKEKHDGYGAEFLFGDALYDYFREWIPEHKKTLKPIVMFFQKGDRERGIQNLELVAKKAFYTRIEAMKFLVDIYSSYEKKEDKDYDRALEIASFLYKQYPNNAYFALNYANLCYQQGKFDDANDASAVILKKVQDKKMGYGYECGRVASFYLADINRRRHRDEEATIYYKKSIAYAHEIDKTDKGYFRSSLYYMAKLAETNEEFGEAKFLFEEVKKYGARRSPRKKEAKKFLKANRKQNKERPLWYTYK